MRFRVLTSSTAVKPYEEDVITHADSEKVALGFTPASAYREAVLSGKLFVAVTEAPGNRTIYAGHLLFGGTYPHIRVFQVYVATKYRRRKVGSLMLQTLIKQGEELGYLNISARVASDLDTANAFWQSEGFHVLRYRKGGASRDRTITVRTKELDTPRLFGGTRYDSVPTAPPLRVIAPVSQRSYVIDLNVFLDLVKALVQAEDVRKLMAASWTRTVDVFVTEELVEEVRRSRREAPD